MKTNLGLLMLLVSGFILGCSTISPRELTLEPNVSLAHRDSLAVAPVNIKSNLSLAPDPEVAVELASDLAAELKTKGYSVSDPNSAPAGSLIVQCKYVSYRPGNIVLSVASGVVPLIPLLVEKPGYIGETISVTLIDKDTAKELAAMEVAHEIDPGPLLDGWRLTTGKHYLQQDVAKAVASAIDKKIKGT